MISALQNLFERGLLARLVIDEAHCVSQVNLLNCTVQQEQWKMCDFNNLVKNVFVFIYKINFFVQMLTNSVAPAIQTL